jgi:hypothetical protein
VNDAPCDPNHPSLPCWSDPCCISAVLRCGKTDVGKVTENKVVTVKPGLRQEWLVAIEGRAADLAFSTRQLAVDFARAYAKLRGASTMQVFNTMGVLEDEEKVDPSSRQSVKV